MPAFALFFLLLLSSYHIISQMGRRREGEGEGAGDSSCSSSSETGHDQSSFFNSSSCLSTDLRLGLTISSSHHTSSSSRQNYKETWEQEQTPSLFVKVNMEGIPFGRKLDLMTHQTYHSLLSTLSHMFKVPIFSPGVSNNRISQKDHILTYQDQDGDWMLVGDVPWEMFLTSVKKLKITKADDHGSQ